MFMPVAFHSLNSPSDVSPGEYAIVSWQYVDPTAGTKLLRLDYTPAGGDAPTVCDLLVLEPGGVIRARDFVFLADRCWRDSAGAKSPDLTQLIPLGNSTRLIQRQELPSITVGAQAPRQTA